MYYSLPLDGRLSRLELRVRLAERVTVVVLRVTLVGLLLTLVHVVRGHNYALHRVRTKTYTRAMLLITTQPTVNFYILFYYVLY